MPATNKNKNRNLRYYLIILVWSTNAIALVLLLLSLLAPVVSPTTTTVFSYIGLAFPIILFINICYLILWIVFMKWRLAAISGLALLVCWNPISTYITLHTKTKDVPSSTIKLLSYNIRVFNWDIVKNKPKSPIIDYIRDSEADIVCLQEFVAGKKKSKHLFNANEIKKMLKHYPYHNITALNRSTSNYVYGLACFSKYPIISAEEIPFHSKDNGSVLYKINVNGKIISVINNHLESNRITAEDKKLYKKLFKENIGVSVLDDVAHNIRSRLGIAYRVRSAQADTIAEYVKRQEKSDGTIVCGDFNDTPISYAYRTIKGNLIDSFKSTGKGVGITYHENNFLFRIDFIMHSENIKSYNCTVEKIKDSDHYPIWTYLELPK